MTTKYANRVRRITGEDIEMLAGRLAKEVEDGPCPQPAHVIRLALRVGSLVAKVGAHVVAEVTAKLGGEQPKQQAVEPIGQGRAWHGVTR